MKSLLPFVRYFVPVPLFYFRGLNLLSASLRYSHKPLWTQSQVTAILQLLWTLFILFGHPRNGKTRTTILSIPFSYRSALIFLVGTSAFLWWKFLPTNLEWQHLVLPPFFPSLPHPLPLLICDFLRLLFSLFVQISLFIIYRKQFRPTRRLHHTLLQKQWNMVRVLLQTQPNLPVLARFLIQYHDHDSQSEHR